MRISFEVPPPGVVAVGIELFHLWSGSL